MVRARFILEAGSYCRGMPVARRGWTKQVAGSGTGSELKSGLTSSVLTPFSIFAAFRNLSGIRRGCNECRIPTAYLSRRATLPVESPDGSAKRVFEERCQCQPWQISRLSFMVSAIASKSAIIWLCGLVLEFTLARNRSSLAFREPFKLLPRMLCVSASALRKIGPETLRSFSE